MTGRLHLKRIYEPPAKADGQRVLVDRIWPRGVRRDEALSQWMKEIAPTPALRTWFGHDPARWDGFRKRYRKELDENPDAVASLRALLEQGDVTLLYGARDQEHNQALVLRDYLKNGTGE